MVNMRLLIPQNTQLEAFFTQNSSTSSMTGSTYLQTRSKRKPWGLVAVVLLHVLVFWAIQAGLTRDIGRQLPQVVQAILLQETPPPPPPAPKVEPTPPAAPPPLTPQPTSPAVEPAPPPPVAVPSPTPPAQVPPVEVAVVSSTTPTQAITAVTSKAPQPTPASTAAAAAAPAAPARAALPTRTPASVSAAQCDKPDYPSASRRMEEEGTVSLRFLVGVDGKVIQSEIEKSSGFKRLDEAARAGLSKCRFQPATVDGRPEQAWASMKYTWRLE
jgi:protein TonB